MAVCGLRLVLFNIITSLPPSSAASLAPKYVYAFMRTQNSVKLEPLRSNFRNARTLAACMLMHDDDDDDAVRLSYYIYGSHRVNYAQFVRYHITCSTRTHSLLGSDAFGFVIIAALQTRRRFRFRSIISTHILSNSHAFAFRPNRGKTTRKYANVQNGRAVTSQITASIYLRAGSLFGRVTHASRIYLITRQRQQQT